MSYLVGKEGQTGLLIQEKPYVIHLTTYYLQVQTLERSAIRGKDLCMLKQDVDQIQKRQMCNMSFYTCLLLYFFFPLLAQENTYLTRISFYIYKLLYLFTSQMSPPPCHPLQSSCSHAPTPLPQKISLTGYTPTPGYHISNKIRSILSYCGQIRPSSATYASGVSDQPLYALQCMLTLWERPRN